MQNSDFHLNDHVDILIEILRRLDGRSLSVAACVCRLWSKMSKNESLWEELCFREVSHPGVRAVVEALGGYKRLYMMCVRRVMKRVGKWGRVGVWSREEVQLWLSLYCVDCYERLGRVYGGDANTNASSLMFLCKTVNV